MIGIQLRRVVVATAAVAVALPLAAGAALAGPRLVTVGSVTDGVLTSSTVSSGESTVFTVTVQSNSTQKLQHTTLYIGQDSGSGVTNDLPAPYPSGVTATAAGCSTVNGILQCSIGTLAKQPFTFTVLLTSDTTVTAQTVQTKALVRVNEGTDSGPNNQAFDAYGDVNFTGFDCDSVTANRANQANKIVTTPCGLTQSNKQQSSIVLPAGRTIVTVQEGASLLACPVVSGLSCIGDATAAEIPDDTFNDVVEWTIKYDITGKNVNTNKLVVYHYDDAGALSPAGGIALKNNACKASNPVNCGSASVTGTTLTITFKTHGNGKTRLLG